MPDIHVENMPHPVLYRTNCEQNVGTDKSAKKTNYVLLLISNMSIKTAVTWIASLIKVFRRGINSVKK